MADASDPVSRLEAWIDPSKGNTQEALARIIGTGQSSVSRWLKRLSKPNLRAALALQRELGIPAELWDRDQLPEQP